MIKIRMTDAQISALECSGVDVALDAAEELVARCWQDQQLVFHPDEADALASALCELSNAEDACAQDAGRDAAERKFAGRAARSLAALMSRVGRAAVSACR